MKNLRLRRIKGGESGIFGEILDENGDHLWYTLEHAFPATITIPPDPDGSPAFQHVLYIPKVTMGHYLCVRGHHQLHSGPVDTFEVTGVKGHSGILFHVGNANKDSEGCILLGLTRETDSIGSSREAFHEFIDRQGGDNFFLTVEN